MTKQEKINELQRMTGKGKMACEINLALAGGDIDKAIERMKKSYPGLEVKKWDQVKLDVGLVTVMGLYIIRAASRYPVLTVKVKEETKPKPNCI